MSIGVPWGSIITAANSAIMNERQLKENKIAAKEAMDFSRSMASSQHQREVRDLREAGLNPILSAGGSGASAPQGVKYDVPELGPEIGSSIASAIDLQRLKQEKIKTQYAEGGKKVYDTSPTARKAIDGANLATQNGLDAKYGVGFNAGRNSAKSIIELPHKINKRPNLELQQPKGYTPVIGPNGTVIRLNKN